MKNKPKLSIPTEQVLRITANLGDSDYSFSMIFPHWTFAKKLAVGKEFRELGVELSNLLTSKLEAAKSESAVGQKVFDELQDVVDAPENYDGLKSFVLKHVLALDGLVINLSEEGDEEKEVLNLVRKEHELFSTILDELWQYEAIIIAVRDKLATFFKR